MTAHFEQFDYDLLWPMFLYVLIFKVHWTSWIHGFIAFLKFRKILAVLQILSLPPPNFPLLHELKSLCNIVNLYSLEVVTQFIDTPFALCFFFKTHFFSPCVSFFGYFHLLCFQFHKNFPLHYPLLLIFHLRHYSFHH